MKKILTMMLASFLLLVQTAGCAVQKTVIAYTVYPVGYLVSRLISDVSGISAESVQEQTIVQRSTLKADYQSILENSSVFLHIGRLEPYLSLYNTEISAAQPSQIDLSAMNAVYDFARYTAVVTDEGTAYVEGPYYKSDAFNLVDTDTKDLYLWTDPIAMLSMAKDIRDFLEETYPDDTSLFETNYESLENDLINLDAQYQALSTSNQQNNKVIRFVSMTASFGNWQKTYGFEVYPVILSKYGVLPNEEQLAVIEQRIQDDGVRYIVYEPNMTDDMIELFNRIEDDLGLTRVELSNLSSLPADDEGAGKDYLSIMYENLSTLQTMVEDRPVTETAADSQTADTNDTQQETDTSSAELTDPLDTPSPTFTPDAGAVTSSSNTDWITRVENEGTVTADPAN